MDLVLAIDIRNTHTRLGLAADGALAAQWSLGTDGGCTADEAVAAAEPDAEPAEPLRRAS